MITTPNPSTVESRFFPSGMSSPVLDSQDVSSALPAPITRPRREVSDATTAVGQTLSPEADEARAEQAKSAEKTAAGNRRDLDKLLNSLQLLYIRAPKVLDGEAARHAHRYPGWRSYDRAEGFINYLDRQWIQLDPDSDFQLDGEPKAGQRVKLLDFIDGLGWERPTTMFEVQNMAMAVFRLLRASPPPPFGDLGGGLSWPIPLDQTTQQAIYKASCSEAEGLYKTGGLPSSNNAAVQMLQRYHWSDADLKDPRAALLKMINTPAAQAAGEQMRARFDGAGSAEDWLLTLLQVGANGHSVMHPNEKNKLAGYDLSQRDNWGKPLSSVVKGLTDHLALTYGRNAPVVAHLLLSHHAPELLVKDVPDTVTYGSPAWVGLKTIVAKANFHTPGAAAGQTYKLLVENDLEPVSNAEKDVEALAGREGLIHWAVADGAIDKRDDNNYTDEELEKARARSSERFDTLKKASHAQRAPLVPLKEKALEILKERFSGTFGHVDFEAKVLMPTQNHQDLRGPYSILDIYMSPQKHVRWYSTDPAVPFDDMFETFRRIPPINQDFEKNITDYQDALTNALGVTVKHLMSLLPAQDREALEYGELSVYAEETTTRSSQHSGRHRGPVTTVAAQPADSRSLLFKTKYGAATTVYEINPQQGSIRKRPDLSDDLKPGLRGEWSSPSSSRVGLSVKTTHTRPSIREVLADSTEEQQKRSARVKAPGALQTFTSARTQYIADTVLNNIFKPGEREAFAKNARGITTFDTEVTVFEEIQAVTRTLVPFASAIDRFQKGKVGEGLGFLALDVLGFVAGGVFAGVKIAKLGPGLAGRAGGIVTRAVISAANPFAGGKAIVSRSLPWWQSAWGKGTSAWRAVSANRGVDRAHRDTTVGLSTGTYTIPGGNSARITAQLDDVTGKWYGYDRTTRTRFGVPLVGFSPDSASA
ncbi:hypothetical protein G7025_23455 [Pseudomonas lurida]|uniref:hypothetical protein n=1 Tax=Pseudomonas TaxID=286 RepID=UPI0015E3F9D7|nr:MULTISPECIES: hypothetical protein [Pseudomonas]MBA1296322.1 hypothetical protein [Pseudomonas lurida]